MILQKQIRTGLCHLPDLKKFTTTMFANDRRGLWVLSRRLYCNLSRSFVTSACPAKDPVESNQVIDVDISVNAQDNLSSSETTIPPERLQFFTNLTGYQTEDVLTFLRRNSRLRTKSISDICKSLETLEDLGIPRSEIQTNAEILNFFPNTLRKRFHCLRELGIRSVGTPEIIRFHQLMAHGANTLRLSGVLATDVEPINYVLKNSPFPEELRNRIYVKSEMTKSMTLQSIRCFVIAEVVQYYFQCDQATSQRLSQYSAKASINYVLETARIMREELDMSVSKLERNPVILGVDPTSIRGLSEVCKSYNLNLKDLVSANANAHRILIKDPETFRQLCQCFTDFDIKLSNVAYDPTLFLFSAKFIKEGLTAMSTWPDFPQIKRDQSFCYLFRSYRYTRRPLIPPELETNDNLHPLSQDESSLGILLDGRELPVERKRITFHRFNRHFTSYLIEKLSCTKQDINKYFCQHRLHNKTPLTNMRDTLDFLFQAGYSQQQIICGLSLLLYPKARVAEYLRRLPDMELAQPFSEWKDNPYILQLLLYAIEKEDNVIFKQNLSHSADGSKSAI